MFAGALPEILPQFDDEDDLQELLAWADEFRRLRVLANADYPQDARQARAFGAQGIGLCRTEHMFFEAERLPLVRQMILSGHAMRSGESGARGRYLEALERLGEFQRADFLGILQAMDGLPVIIRLIDPPFRGAGPHRAGG
ncbi:MAG: hypothetical protein NTZ05_21040 [Chloroflexi bacterium]|nr:hypothetical protein [Chloroflexota bacterium]